MLQVSSEQLSPLKLQNKFLKRITDKQKLKQYRKSQKTQPQVVCQNEYIQKMHNENLKKLMIKRGLHQISNKDLFEQRNFQIKLKNENRLQLLQTQQRKWMAQKGRQHLVDYTDKERHTLKKYFNNLDNQNCGVAELQSPFISLGIVESTNEIKQIISQVDYGGNGTIEFDEFLKFIKKTSNKDSNQKSVKFFKNMMSNKLTDDQMLGQLSFQTMVSFVRRKKFLDAISSTDITKRTEGFNLMKQFEKIMLNDLQKKH